MKIKWLTLIVAALLVSCSDNDGKRLHDDVLRRPN